MPFQVDAFPTAPTAPLYAATSGQVQRDAAGCTPGWCGVHVVQYQKNEGPAGSDGNKATSDYRFDVEIFDADQNSIAKVSAADAPADQAVNLQGPLPLPLVVEAQNVDSDPVLFSYKGDNWDSTDTSHHCNFGGYDSGSRQGDCGFTC